MFGCLFGNQVLCLQAFPPDGSLIIGKAPIVS